MLRGLGCDMHSGLEAMLQGLGCGMHSGPEAMLRGLGWLCEPAKADGGSRLPAKADTTLPLVVGPGAAADFGRG